AHDDGVGSPDSEARAFNPFNGCWVCAESVIPFVVRSFGMQMQVELGHQRLKPISVFYLRGAALIIRDAQFVIGRKRADLGSKDTGYVGLLHQDMRSIDSNFDLLRLGEEGSNLPLDFAVCGQRVRT